ncbi:hypothetical protein FHW69_003752 [Luteibacter sp. Sphag1AF]|uniref:hypothetical protein n=1 Tax=Luteibacter sp. Sphag1AF TaxID=2587031 RepID=UPI00161814E8|nr:hypothetical protein [Luteibacter sp. Sphag1AF]MBB3229100.1 hypothetical protein [Luteibacter sp. Sphag1AF]
MEKFLQSVMIAACFSWAVTCGASTTNDPPTSEPWPDDPPIMEDFVSEDHDDAILAMLRTPLVEYGAALESYLGEASANNRASINDQDLVRIYQQIRRATFAQLIYTFTRDNVQQTRVYLAVSGRPFRDLTQNSPHLHLPELRPELLDDPDGPYYRLVSPAATFASAGVPANSDITPSPVSPKDPTANHNDAEIRALQTLVREIASGEVVANGHLEVYVSRGMCPSCARAMARFAARYNVDTHVTSIRGTGEPREQTPIWRDFRAMREEMIAYLQHVFVPPAERGTTTAGYDAAEVLSGEDEDHPPRNPCHDEM